VEAGRTSSRLRVVLCSIPDNMAKVLLDGKSVLGTSPARWVLREGTVPVIEDFDLLPEDAAAIIAKGGPLTLDIEGIRFANLWCLGEAPSDSPYWRRVKISDRRWFWPYTWVIRRYNMRKRTGVYRSIAIDVPELAPALDTIQFHEWSLYNPTPGQGGTGNRWTAENAIKDVLQVAVANSKGGVPAISIQLSGAKQVPLENVEIDDAGDSAVDRILKYLPEARVWLNAEGNVIVDKRTDGTEAGMVSILGPEIQQKGHVVKLSNALLRPSKINVFYSREVELRFDFAEPNDAAGTTAMGPTTRAAENVLPSPDYQLQVGGSNICEGTWITLPEAMNAWGKLSPTFGQLNYDILCKAFVPWMDLWSALQHLGSLMDRQNWGPRIAAIQANWRQTFRINPRWTARVMEWRAYRVATIDNTLGSRAPAVAYQDYTAIGTQRLWLNNIRADEDAQYARIYTCYPATSPYNLDSTSRPSPAEVSIVDSDQGIIRADLQVDTIRLTDMVIPGKMVAATIPTAKIDMAGRDFRPVTFDSVIRGTQADNIPRMERKHRIAFILTAIPGAPNNLSQLQKVEIKPGDVGVDGACNGPEWNVRVGANIETARYKWTDSQADVIEKAFGVNNEQPTVQYDALSALEASCVNLKGGAEGAASLQSIAKSVAARIYAQFADHFVGHASGIINGALHPAGWLAEVVHEVATSGETVSSLHMPERLPALSLFSYLDQNSRAAVMHLVK
jgi:hypothetical protein